MARKNILKAREERRQALRRDLRIVGIILAAALVIVAIMPRTTGLNYSYELGQPWRYGELISTEKFNIQMSDSDLVVQKDSMKRAFYPYFTIDSKMVGNVKESITALNADKELTLRLSYVIDTIYSHGVMAIHDYDSLTELGTEYIRMIGGNVAKAVPMDHVMTTHQAYKYIIDNPLFKSKTAEIGELNLNTLLAERKKRSPRIHTSSASVTRSFHFVSIARSISSTVVNGRSQKRMIFAWPKCWSDVKYVISIPC